MNDIPKLNLRLMAFLLPRYWTLVHHRAWGLAGLGSRRTFPAEIFSTAFADGMHVIKKVAYAFFCLEYPIL
jgi:hypothetical protein